MKALKIAAIGVCVIYFITLCVLAYWYFEKPPEMKIPIPFVKSIDQYQGHAELLDVPVAETIGAGHPGLEIRLLLVDHTGAVRMSTPYEVYDSRGDYKFLVSRKVEAGEYNVVMSMLYRLNFLNVTVKRAPLIVLNLVKKKEEPHDNRSPDKDIVSQP